MLAPLVRRAIANDARVVLTDGDARVCTNLRHNASLNGLGDDDDPDLGRCRVAVFRWDEADAFFASEPEAFDVVVAADCESAALVDTTNPKVVFDDGRAKAFEGGSFGPVDGEVDAYVLEAPAPAASDPAPAPGDGDPAPAPAE